MIELAGVTQHYGVRPVLRKLDLRIAANELVVIIGPNGMGKSTLLSVMAGVLQPQKGLVTVNGTVRRSSPESELAIRRQVAYLPDHPWLPQNRTGREFLLGVGELYEREVDELMDHVDRLLRVFELEKEGDWPIRSYSNGQQKKIAIAGALVTRAPIHLLDEPFSGGLDPSGILALKHILRHMVEKDGCTVVMTTPVAELMEEIADRIIVLKEGEVLAHDTAEGLRAATGSDGNLEEVLARLLHPQTMQNIRQYFEEPAT